MACSRSDLTGRGIGAIPYARPERDGNRAVCDYNTRQSDLVVATGLDTSDR